MSSSPLYATIRDRIQQELVTPLAAEGGRLPPVRELAQRYQVTTATVAKALHELTLAGLVRQRVGSGSFVLPRPRLTTLGLLYEGPIVDERPETRFFGHLDAALQRAMAGHACRCRHFFDVRLGELRSEPLPELMQAARQREIDALIVVRGDRQYRDRWLLDLGIPVLSWQRELGQTSVALDLHQAGRLAAGDLIRQGFRRIACLGPILCEDENPEQAAQYNRPLRAGIAEALAEVGAPGPRPWNRSNLPPELSPHWNQGGLRERGQACTRWLLKEDRPDAIVAFPDVLAAGCADALVDAGLDDLSLPLLVIGNTGLTVEGLAGRRHLEVDPAALASALIASALASCSGGTPSPRLIAYHLR